MGKVKFEEAVVCGTIAVGLLIGGLIIYHGGKRQIIALHRSHQARTVQTRHRRSRLKFEQHSGIWQCSKPHTRMVRSARRALVVCSISSGATLVQTPPPVAFYFYIFTVY